MENRVWTHPRVGGVVVARCAAAQCLATALGLVGQKRVLWRYPPLTVTAWQSGTGAVFTTVVALLLASPVEDSMLLNGAAEWTILLCVPGAKSQPDWLRPPRVACAPGRGGVGVV